jgi:hypothetical protein
MNSEMVKSGIMMLIGRKKTYADGLQPATEALVGERERKLM